MLYLNWLVSFFIHIYEKQVRFEFAIDYLVPLYGLKPAFEFMLLVLFVFFCVVLACVMASVVHQIHIESLQTNSILLLILSVHTNRAQREGLVQTSNMCPVHLPVSFMFCLRHVRSSVYCSMHHYNS